MKTLIVFILVFGSSLRLAYAQNSVSVKQNGNGNTAIINQSAKSQSTKKATNCSNTDHSLNQNDNAIQIKKTGGAKKTYKTTGAKENSFYLNQAAANRLSFINLWGLTDKISAIQEGKGNGILLHLNGNDTLKSAPNDFHLSQRGQNNAIIMNPCPQNKIKNKGSRKALNGRF